MTRRQRINLWKKMSMCFDHHEREMIKQQQQEDGRWNWYGLADEADATSMDDDLPSAAEDCAKVKGNYEL